MKKKILIGSIVAVGILIGISFSSVVGYNKVTSNVKESPLFKIRTSRAIDEESQGLTCDYIGKGKEEISPISPDFRISVIQTVLETITKMDDKTYNNFLAKTMNRLIYENKLNDKNTVKMITSLRYLRSNPEQIKEYLINLKRENDDKNAIKQPDYTLSGEWKPRCLVELILEMLMSVIAIVYFMITIFANCLQSIFTDVGCCPCYRPQLRKVLIKI